MRGVLLLAESAEIGRAIARCRAFNRMPVALARFAFALIDAEDIFDSLKPPAGVCEIGSRIEAKPQSTPQH